MRKTRFTIPGLSFIICSLIVSCSKDCDIPQQWPPDEVWGCVAGQHGSTQLVLTAMHHTKIIPSQPTYPDTAYIKFNTSEFPGDNASLYDLVVAGVGSDTTITINNMACGNYYIFMTGFDTGIVERVKGGIPVAIYDEDVVRNINVPVTED